MKLNKTYPYFHLDLKLIICQKKRKMLKKLKKQRKIMVKYIGQIGLKIKENAHI